MKSAYLIIVCMLLGGCIGQDVIDITAMPAQLSISPDQGVLRVGENLSFSSAYLDAFGQPADASISWTSSDPGIIRIDGNGLANALSVGQVTISAASADAQSNTALVTVVDNDNSVASITISGPATIAVGESAVYQAQALNISGVEIPGITFTWSSNNTIVATVDSNGEVQGIASGEVSISAEAEGISSSPTKVIIGSSARTATFESSGGYKAEGIADLAVESGGKLILKLSSDFETSFALGTFIYLANSTNGSLVNTEGLELGEITQNGSHTFNISDLDSSVELNTFRYVVILCKPASITFGFADFDK